MIDHLRDQLKFAKTQGDGKSYADHLRQFAISTGEDPDEYLRSLQESPDPPELLNWIWTSFLELHATRQAGTNGPLSITFLELKAWSELYGYDLQPWELDIIRRLDDAWLEEVNKDHGNSRGTRTKNKKPGGGKG